MIEIPMYVQKLSSDLSGGWWNYRFVEKTEKWKKDGKVYFEKRYEIHEVYYAGDGRIWSWTESPIDISVQSYKELKEFLKSIKLAAKKPVLELQINNDDEQLIETDRYLKDIAWEDITNY